MTTKEKIATHTKAIEILELLERAEKRLVESQEDLYNYRNASKAEQLRSIYCGTEYEFKVKKGERSVSFIKGMYERYVNKMFANSWETPGYTVTTLPFKTIDFTGGINLSREYKDVLHFPMPIGGPCLAKYAITLPEDFKENNNISIIRADGSTEPIFLENRIPYYTCGPEFYTAMRAAAERIFKNQKYLFAGLVEPVDFAPTLIPLDVLVPEELKQRIPQESVIPYNIHPDD